VEGVETIVYLIIFSPNLPHFIILELDLSLVQCEVVKGEGVLTAIEHVDRALQYRLEYLQEMQAQYIKTGVGIDEREFTKNGKT
jgi:hypothetical protein